MFGIGIQEALVILAVALLVLGPTKLPGVARTLGKGLRELRKASDDLRTALMFDDEDEAPKRRRATPPSAADAPVVGADAANAAPGIHGSLAAGAGDIASDDDGPVAVPADPDAVVSRGETGGDPHKRALDPRPRADAGPPRHEPFTNPDVPADADAVALLDEGRRERDAAEAERRPNPGEKDATT